MQARTTTVRAAVSEAGAVAFAERRRRASGALPLVLGSALLGTIGVFVEHGRADPLTMTWFRCAFGWLGLSLWLAARRELGAVHLPRSAAPWVFTAAIALLGAWALFFAAIPRTSTGMAVVLFQFQPLWVLLLGAWWLREPIGRRRLAAVCLAMLGLILATRVLSTLPGLGAPGAVAPGYWVGVGLCLAGSWCTALVTIIAKRLRALPAGVLAWWQCAIGAATLWLWPTAHGWPAWGGPWLWLAGLGLVHTGLVYALMYAGIGKLPASRTAVLQFAYPAVAVAIDRACLGARMDHTQLLGIAVMAAALVMAGRESVSATTGQPKNAQESTSGTT